MKYQHTTRISWLRWVAPCLLLSAMVMSLVLAAGGPRLFFYQLDPNNAGGVCFDGHQPKLMCDYANVYYPQGLALQHSAKAQRGFYYSPFFAVCMWLLAQLPAVAAGVLWFALILIAVAALVSLPSLLGVLRSTRAALAYAALLAWSMPLLHDLLYGQVSSILCVLTALSLLAYGRTRHLLSAVLLGLASAVKFYPGLFALYYVARRDWRTTLQYSLILLLSVGVLPWLAFGSNGYLLLVRSIVGNLGQLSRWLAKTHYSNAATTVLTLAGQRWFGLQAGAHAIAVTLSACLAASQLLLMIRAARRSDALSALLFGFAALPFVVRSCWMHYFVFLPLLQTYVLQASRTEGTARLARWCAMIGPIGSAILLSYPYFILFDDPDAYYRSGLPLWATLLVLPGLSLTQFAGRYGLRRPARVLAE